MLVIYSSNARRYTRLRHQVEAVPISGQAFTQTGVNSARRLEGCLPAFDVTPQKDGKLRRCKQLNRDLHVAIVGVKSGESKNSGAASNNEAL